MAGQKNTCLKEEMRQPGGHTCGALWNNEQKGMKEDRGGGAISINHYIRLPNVRHGSLGVWRLKLTSLTRCWFLFLRITNR